MARDTTHEYECTECGVRMKGRRRPDGMIVASNAAPSGETQPCVCTTCARAS